MGHREVQYRGLWDIEVQYRGLCDTAYGEIAHTSAVILHFISN